MGTRTPDPGGARRVRLDADDRREQILAAAQRLFAHHPYTAVSTADLAAEAGTTRTNLHYYFGTKRDLYVEALRRFARLPALPPPGSSSGEDEVARVLGRWLDVVERHPRTVLTMIGSTAPDAAPDVQAVFREGLRAWEDRLIAVLELPDTPGSRARIRAFQGLAGAAVVEWLHRGTLGKAEVHALMTRTLPTIVREP